MNLVWTSLSKSCFQLQTFEAKFWCENFPYRWRGKRRVVRQTKSFRLHQIGRVTKPIYFWQIGPLIIIAKYETPKIITRKEGHILSRTKFNYFELFNAFKGITSGWSPCHFLYQCLRPGHRLWPHFASWSYFFDSIIFLLRIIQNGCFYLVLPAVLLSLWPDCPATSSLFLPLPGVKR